MAYCYNCKREIPDDDKTKLCDKCKSFMLPFIKFMDASTSSAVRRLISNERNLRNAGVTDNGMEYMLKLCELHDKKKLKEKEEKLAARAASEAAAAQREEAERRAEREREFSEIEIPMDEPLKLNRRHYGGHLDAAWAVCLISGAGLLLWFIIELIIDNTYNVVAVVGSFPAFAMAYVIHVLRKMLHDVKEIKKRFR